MKDYFSKSSASVISEYKHLLVIYISRGTGLANILSVQLWMCSCTLVLKCVLGAQENRVIESVLLSNHNMCFWSRDRQSDSK